MKTIGSILVWIGALLVWLSGCHPPEPTRSSVAATAVTVAAAVGKGGGTARVSRPARGGGVETWDLTWFDEWMEGQRVNVEVKADEQRGLTPAQKAAIAAVLAAVVVGLATWQFLAWRARRALPGLRTMGDVLADVQRRL